MNICIMASGCFIQMYMHTLYISLPCINLSGLVLHVYVRTHMQHLSDSLPFTEGCLLVDALRYICRMHVVNCYCCMRCM